jgi:glycosyltransferase involved in cell wall biosynthesis
VPWRARAPRGWEHAFREARDVAARALALAADWRDQDAACAEFARALVARRFLLGLLRRPAQARIAAARDCARHAGADRLLTARTLHDLLRRRTVLGLLRRTRAAGAAIVRDTLRESLRAGREDQATRLSAALERITAPVRDAEDDLVSPCSLRALDVLRAAGLGASARPLPDYLSRCLEDALAAKGLPADADLDWARQIVAGFSLPPDEAWLREAVERVRGSALFDAADYARRLALEGDAEEAARHYVLIGDALGIAPSQKFDPAYYAARNDDVRARGAPRLAHYLLHGAQEGRKPVPPAALRRNPARMDPARENVIVVVHETTRTGAPVLGWNIASHLAARYNVFTVALEDGPLTDAFAALSAELHGPFAQHHTHPVDLAHGLRRLFDGRDFAYAVVNSCESIQAIAPCFDRLVPTVLLMHEFGAYVGYREALGAAFDKASEIVFPAPIVAQSSLAVHPPLRDRSVRIVPQGVCAMPAQRADGQATLPPALTELAAARAAGAFVVLGAGSVIFRKGVDLFIATAMAVCREAGERPVRFLWIGRGYRPDEDMAYAVYLREQLERSGLAEPVTFLDELADLEPAYALADILLLTSRLDPLPNVSIDAAHRGIPIVCFDGASGIAEILRDDPATAAGVVPHLDVSAAADAILALVRDADAWRLACEATRALGRARFDMTRYCAELDVLGRGAAERLASRRRDAALLASTDDFDRYLFVGPRPAIESREETIRRAMAHEGRPGEAPSRPSAAGLDAVAWRRRHAEDGQGHPLAAFVRSGRPDGPWRARVLGPLDVPEPPADGRATALLHVHLTDRDRIADLAERLRRCRTPVDLRFTTDRAALRRPVRDLLGLPGGMAPLLWEGRGDPFDRLAEAARDPAWEKYAVIGHLRDDGDPDAVAGCWAALLGAHSVMLDRLLFAFADDASQGLVTAAAGAGAEGRMAWMRRAVLRRAAARGDASAPVLKAACAAEGLRAAVAYLPGVTA